MTRPSSELVCSALSRIQDKNLLIPVTPPSDGGMGVGYARGGTPGMIARAENGTI